ncbi:MAG: lipid IV(A) 3-deoxy-D-manno-octulosonic acid transferase [Fluviibacter sp.]
MSMPSAAPWFYRALLTLIVPLALLRLWWRGRKQPGYRQHIAERFGYINLPAGGPIIWLHAVSVGETRAAEPLVHALLEQYPGHRVLLTHMTPTGRATSTALYKDPRILIAYVPYDLTSAVDRFLTRVQPQLGLLMETEIWPNLILRSRAHQVPMLLINARMSARSGRRYARFDKLIRPVLSALSTVGAQTQDDADRLTQLGAQNVSVTGNLKFDVRIDPALQMLGQQWRRDIQTQQTRPIWLAASTREGEEAVILAAHRALCALMPHHPPLLVLVPRHPQRFNDIAQLIAREGFTLARRNAALPTAETDVWLGDSMGEMVAYYSLANVAVIGGTLLPFGGQNLIEAAACGTPLIIGPHTYNFSTAATAAAQTGAAIRIDTVTPETLANTLHALINNPTQHQAATKATARFVSSATGATDKLLALIARYSRP